MDSLKSVLEDTLLHAATLRREGQAESYAVVMDLARRLFAVTGMEPCDLWTPSEVSGDLP